MRRDTITNLVAPAIRKGFVVWGHKVIFDVELVSAFEWE